ncbi:MAG: double zinc ribbon domain-containing protein [Patescibacteria group bacterium]|jgi:competence protein ComFC
MFLIDLLFPKFCLGCGYIGVYLCSSCLKKLEPTKQDICLYCKKPSLFGLTHPGCSKTLDVDGLIAIYHYNPILKKIIKNIKYRLAVQVWEDFCRTIIPEAIEKLNFYKKISLDLVIQPIPLSIIKYNERGFNQAKIISVFFQKFLPFPIIDLLICKKERSSQAQTKNKIGRYLNVQDAFAIQPKSRGLIYQAPNIILIDDVVTSGSTVKEAARVLKLAGAKKVFVLALAKG